MREASQPSLERYDQNFALAAAEALAETEVKAPHNIPSSSRIVESKILERAYVVLPRRQSCARSVRQPNLLLGSHTGTLPLTAALVGQQIGPSSGNVYLRSADCVSALDRLGRLCHNLFPALA